MKELSACFVGLGSIGKRHLRNLHAVARERGLAIAVDALRHAGASPLDAETASLIRQEYSSADDLGHYDLIFICNPTQLHYDTLCLLMDRGEKFFIEKPLSVKVLDDAELGRFSEDRFYVACPIRHTKVFGFLNDFTRMNRVFSARAICSSYLPDWRPGQDYRKVYAADRTSGGVKLDLVHEFDYLVALFGLPRRHFLAEGRFSDLEIACNDTVAYVGEYADKLVELHLDYHGRTAQRYVELNVADEVVRCDFLKSEIGFLKSGKVILLSEDRNEYCKHEIGYFLRFAEGTVGNINSVRHANAILNLILR